MTHAAPATARPHVLSDAIAIEAYLKQIRLKLRCLNHYLGSNVQPSDWQGTEAEILERIKRLDKELSFAVISLPVPKQPARQVRKGGAE